MSQSRPEKVRTLGSYLEEGFQLSGGFKTHLSIILLIWGACLILPCLGPRLIQSVSILIEVMVKRKMATRDDVMEI